MADWSELENGDYDYSRLFSVPMWASVACLLILSIFYPWKRPIGRPTPEEEWKRPVGGPMAEETRKPE